MTDTEYINLKQVTDAAYDAWLINATQEAYDEYRALEKQLREEREMRARRDRNLVLRRGSRVCQKRSFDDPVL